MLHSTFQKGFAPTTAAGVAMSVEILPLVADHGRRKRHHARPRMANRHASNVLNTVSPGVEPCERNGRPNVKAHLDTYHMNIEESDVMTAIRTPGAQRGYFHGGYCHGGDLRRRHLGSGRIDFAAVFRSRIFAGSTGPITFESPSSRVVDQLLARSLAVWRNSREDGRHLASHALLSLRAQLQSAQAALKQVERSRLP